MSRLASRSRLRPDAAVWLPNAHKHDFVLGVRPVVRGLAAALDTGASLATAVPAVFAEFPQLTRYFDLAPETFGLRDDLLFVHDRPSRIGVQVDGTTHRIAIRDAENIADVRRVLRALTESSPAVPDILATEFAASFLSVLESAGALVPDISSSAQARAPVGITRLQHAAVLIRTEHHGVLIDPLFHSPYARGIRDDLTVTAISDQVDAVLISHSHDDHYSPSSLMMFSPDTPIVVPRVSRESLLADDMARNLRRAGFTAVHSPEWFDPPITFGDIEVHCLPFYGEQPLRNSPPRHVDLRNVGNTYLIKTPHFSCWLMVDSGSDWMGTMADVAMRVHSEIGEVDYILSNLKSFVVGAGRSSPFYIAGGGHYWLALTARQIETFRELCGERLTMGPDGVAEVARMVGARAILPYAHWWQAGPDPVEAELARQVRDQLDRAGSTARVLAWNVGDSYELGLDGEARRVRWTESRHV